MADKRPVCAIYKQSLKDQGKGKCYIEPVIDDCFLSIFLCNIRQPFYRLPVMFPHHREYIGQAHLLGIFREIHNTIDICNPAVVRSHILVPHIVQLAVFPVEYEITDYGEQDEQNGQLVNLKHENKCTYARDKAEQASEYHLHSLYQPVISLFHGQGIFVIKVAVFKAFQFHIPGFSEKLGIQSFVHDSLAYRIYLSIQDAVIE